MQLFSVLTPQGSHGPPVPIRDVGSPTERAQSWPEDEYLNTWEVGAVPDQGTACSKAWCWIGTWCIVGLTREMNLAGTELTWWSSSGKAESAARGQGWRALNSRSRNC